ncbi:MAG: hypothetical protein L6Q77_12005 [Bacteroidetes bacterium]|nr:hypothetical protein [Bacteroidota bacterium]
MKSSFNPAGCIDPSCRCIHKCRDLFPDGRVPGLKAGVCRICSRISTVYRQPSGYECKSCIAGKTGNPVKETA